MATEALPANQSPTKTGKIQHISEYYSNDHHAVPEPPKRPTPINPDIVSDPKPEEKVHLIPPKDETEEKAIPALHRQRRVVDETEAQDQPTTAKPTRAWWRRMNFRENLRTTEEPKKASEEEEVPQEEVSEVSKEESVPENEEDCEKDEESAEVQRVQEHSVHIQHIQTQPLPVIPPHRDIY